VRALAIAVVNLRRLFRDRIGLFFIFVLPVVLIVVLGTVFGGRTAPRLGIVVVDGGPLATELVEAIREGEMELEVRTPSDEARLQAAVEDGSLELGLVVPAGYDAALRDGGRAEVRVIGLPTTALSALRRAVDTAVAGQAARVRAARLVQAEAGIPFDEAIDIATDVQAVTPGIEVTVERIGEGIFPEGTTAFAPGAQSQLVLFMFLTSMTAATQIILSRQLGVSRRMLAAPIGVSTIVVGEILGRFGVALVQGLFIVFLSALVFGVPWGDPLAAGMVVIVFALVGTGAAMVVGVFANDVDQAGSLGVMAGMLLGALGGAMVPLEIFPEPMHTIAYLTPQAWAIQGLRTVGLRGGGVADILPELAVLGLFAVGLMTLGTWRFRRVLSR
jgi:ABC-2 type transport system permease protein